jgi:pimeloyl-ACP methyl ester carboxylesterase
MPTVDSMVVKQGTPNRAHRKSFTFAITCISRFMIYRDRVLGWSKAGRRAAGIAERVSRHSIASAQSVLDAVFVEPASGQAAAAVLLCHGIGETVEQWFGVQQLLAANGVASMVFDYAGYGRSTGRPDWDQFELDAAAAFAALEKMAPQLAISVVGFSLGSGVATATINQLNARSLILCEAFTSFREAAAAAWVPKALARLVPPIWDACPPLSQCKLPVLIVHGEKDWLFPKEMAADLAGYCNPKAEVVLVPNTAHNQPFRTPRLEYWGPVIAQASR